MDQLRQDLAYLSEKISIRGGASLTSQPRKRQSRNWSGSPLNRISGATTQQAQRKMQQMGRLRDTLSLWREFESRCRDLIELTDLAIEENELSIQEELETGAAELGLELAREEIKLTLSGPYDERSAIVAIHSGAGGTDSQDWAEMLLRMYAGWAESGKRPVEVMDLSYGDEAGLAQRNAGSGRQPCFRLSERRAGSAPACPAVTLRP